MTMGAFTAVVFNLSCASTFGAATPWLGALLGGIIGLIFSLLHAVATINFRADHVISGTVLNLMAPPLAVFLVKALYNKGQTENITQTLATSPSLAWPRFQFWGQSSSRTPQRQLGYPSFWPSSCGGSCTRPALACVCVLVVKTLKLLTLWGSTFTRCATPALISGFLGGIGGAIFAEAISSNFSVSTIAGQGFMALAAMIFGRYNPIGAMLSSLFFGFAQSLSIIGNQIPGISSLPSVYLQIAPYVLTIIVLVIFFGKTVGPAADGQNYIKSK